MILYLTRCNGGRYMMTLLEPSIHRILGTSFEDVFEAHGDPITVRYMCEEGIKRALGTTLAPLTPTKVKLTLELI